MRAAGGHRDGSSDTLPPLTRVQRRPGGDHADPGLHLHHLLDRRALRDLGRAGRAHPGNRDQQPEGQHQSGSGGLPAQVLVHAGVPGQHAHLHHRGRGDRGLRVHRGGGHGLAVPGGALRGSAGDPPGGHRRAVAHPHQDRVRDLVAEHPRHDVGRPQGGGGAGAGADRVAGRQGDQSDPGQQVPLPHGGHCPPESDDQRHQREVPAARARHVRHLRGQAAHHEDGRGDAEEGPPPLHEHAQV